MKYCSNCGKERKEGADVCLGCGKAFSNDMGKKDPNAKSKLAAGLLGLFLGGVGVHNFYLGFTAKAVAQLLLTVVGWVVIIGPIVAAVWSFVESIMILTGSINTDAFGNPLTD